MNVLYALVKLYVEMPKGNKSEPALTAALTEDFFLGQNLQVLWKIQKYRNNSKFPIKIGLDLINGNLLVVGCNYSSAFCLWGSIIQLYTSRKTWKAQINTPIIGWKPENSQKCKFFSENWMKILIEIIFFEKIWNISFTHVWVCWIAQHFVIWSC